MAANYARLRDQTMNSWADDEAVTVNTRALIDKVLARYSGEWTTLRELIQNAADAQAKTVTIRFETRPSTTVPQPLNGSPSDLLRHVLTHHTLKTLLVSNDGQHFGENDWQRLKRIAEGNPDETKIGAFGVGFYSVFADCETPFVSSGRQTMAFYWKKDSLFTRRGKISPDQQPEGTTFLLDYRSPTTPVPGLLSLCQFLATSLTFVGLERIDLHLDDWKILHLTKKMSPGVQATMPPNLITQTQNGLMKIVNVEYQQAQIDATWINAVGWDKTTTAQVADESPKQSDHHSGFKSWFSRIAHSTQKSFANTTARKARREEEILQQSIIKDLTGLSQSTVFLKLSTVHVITNINKQLSHELERATKKPPPKTTKIAILTTSHDESLASISTGTAAAQSSEIFAWVLPTKTGKIFIGFPTGQTTGLHAHISAPSVIPTVERESIDLNARYVRDWNIEMLRVAGIACRMAYSGEMADLNQKIVHSMASTGRKKVTDEDVQRVMPSAIHTYKQYTIEETTPSEQVGNYIEEAFWSCNRSASIEVLSARGILPSELVRVATEDLSFVSGIPTVPGQVMDQAGGFITRLRTYELLVDITISDIKRELEAQALTETQVKELLRWCCKKVSAGELDAGSVKMLFDGTLGSLDEEFAKTAASPVIQLGKVQTFVNASKIPPDMPTPGHTVPFRMTKELSPAALQSLGWHELMVEEWLKFIVETDGRAFGEGQRLTATPAVAAKVLPVVSRAWDSFSTPAKETVILLLAQRTVIPTRLGMRTPPQAYFASVRLFDDLPTITGLQGVKEKFLGALGVRKTIEIGAVLNRLMKSPTSETKWSHVELIRYLVSVASDIPPADITMLQNTPLCTAEDEQNGKLFRLCELYEPSERLRKIKLPLLYWPGTYNPHSAEGQMLCKLGLRKYPSMPEIVGMLHSTPLHSILHGNIVEYLVTNYYLNGYNKYPMSEVQTAFVPVVPLPGEAGNMISIPSQCYANPKAAILDFRIMSEALRPHHSMFGVAMDPPIELAARRLIQNPPGDRKSAIALFSYFVDRLSEIPVRGKLAQELGNAPIVPVSGRFDLAAPTAVYLGDGKTLGEVFDFVDFGNGVNPFLLRVGSKHEPSAVEIAEMLAKQPTRLLQTLGQERYLTLLRRVAENMALLQANKTLWRDMKRAECLLAVQEVAVTNADDEKYVKEYSLANASSMVIVDDFLAYRRFQSSLKTAPQEEDLENLYSALDTPRLSSLVEDDLKNGSPLRDQTAAEELRKRIIERCRLFLHDHSSNVIRHDGRWLERNLTVKAVESLRITHRLKGYRLYFNEERTATLSRPTKTNAILFITRKFNMYEVSRAIVSLILHKPSQHHYLALEIILESNLKQLKVKGFNVDRILEQKAAESRLAESERRKNAEQSIEPATPAPKPPKVPGAFEASSPETSPQNWLANALGMSNDAPPPYPGGDSNLSPESRPTTPTEIDTTLLSAIQASRSFTSSKLTTCPQTTHIKEVSSYCDTSPAQNLLLISNTPLKIFVSRNTTAAGHPSKFLHANHTSLQLFTQILTQAAGVLTIPPEAVNIFHDESGGTIAFNSSGSLFCNLRVFRTLHEEGMRTQEGRRNALVYWWVTLCHELAHNLVREHSTQHGFWTESFVIRFFGGLAGVLGGM
ncbi:hypothetical protein K470DRAFT_257159 [Piedraia hortae CBS 480.64]|uniref:Sacsin/Nov domain-containing protein n=1 Tax=Piedraia hortae CBS 480.64 TaxID=1314780 RepID=A0A6A7C100_9PEZI|nr:hypothetical protein K470DRAFT_257159 [Piedraia hortae CBS 480.64]